jgi:5-dehydro-2-deoxygluconokinase
VTPVRDLITVGRISVDLYAQELGASFSDPQTFSKSVGGSPTNVAVAGARYGLASAVITQVGADPLGDYVRQRLNHWGVDTEFVGVDESAPTPVVLAAMDPPEDPKIVFYRGDRPPDVNVQRTAALDDAVAQTRAFWVSLGAMAAGSTAACVREWLDMRQRSQHVITDLDFRPSMWPSIEAAREATLFDIDRSTVVVGNRAECDVAVGTTDADEAADAFLARGVHLAIVKLGGGGVMLATESERVRIDPLSIDVVCGLGAGDAFGGALVHGLLQEWNIATIGEFANAAGALVVEQLTCADAMPEESHVRAMMVQNGRAEGHS